METYSDIKKVNGFNWHKFNLFIFFSLQIFLVEACQFKFAHQDVLNGDQIRSHQAQQILQDRLNPSDLKPFEGDPQFSRYLAHYIETKNSSLNSPAFTQKLLQISREHSYDPVFLLAIIKTESSFDQNAIGTVGEVGLMQIRPETAEWICQKSKIAWRGANALKDPQYNLLIGSYYFKYLRSTLKSESFKYITAYNMGINKMQRRSEEELKAHDYFDKVVKNYLKIYSDLRRIKARS